MVNERITKRFCFGVTRSNDFCNLQRPPQLATAETRFSAENFKLRMITRLMHDCNASGKKGCYTLHPLKKRGQSLQKVEQTSTLSNRCENNKATLHSTEPSCYTRQSVCNSYRNGVATQVLKTFLSPLRCESETHFKL